VERYVVGVVAEAVEYGGLRFIVGPGLDDVLEPGMSVVLLDSYYANIYGDYLFLGYDAYATQINVGYADLTGIATAVIVSSKPSVVVCGEDPAPCTLLLAAKMMVDSRRSPMDALREAWGRLSRIYPDSCRAIPREPVAALEAFGMLLEMVGWEKLQLLLSLASNYEYGRGARFYGELVTWLYKLGAGREALEAALLSFLAYSRHGPPWEILRYRLEAVGEASLLTAFGGWVEEGLATLRRAAEGRLDGGAGQLAYVLALQPGEEIVHLAAIEEGHSTIYCSGVESPSRDCVKAAGEADRVAAKAGLEGWAKPRLVAGRPRPLTLCSGGKS
jgi:hypothetical protein